MVLMTIGPDLQMSLEDRRSSFAFVFRTFGDAKIKSFRNCTDLVSHILGLVMKSIRALFMLVALPLSLSAQAVSLSGSGTSFGVWTYDLALAPLDNYSVFPVGSESTNLTTITLTGLVGVTGASGPTSTTFAESSLNSVNLQWTAQVLNGGTEVQWTHVGPGTGNFPETKFIYGFQVFAPGSADGLASYLTSGFSRDVGFPLPGNTFNVDVTGRLQGPTLPVPEPETYALMLAGLGLVGLMARKQKNQT